jgi:exopolysaccharide production protein ExoQ
MTGSIATLLYTALILGLLRLDREPRERTSAALWLPVIWFLLAGSRSASEWLQSAPPGGTAEALLEGDPINRVVYAGLVLMGLIVLGLRASRTVGLLRANALMVAFMFYCALSLTWAEYPDVGFKRWVKAMGDLIMVLIVVSERDPPAAIRQLLTRTGFILIPLSVLMIKYYPELARYYDRWEWETYYSGVTTNKNALGAICLLFGLASGWQLLAALFGPDQSGRVRRLIAHGVLLAMAAWLLRLANSMTALSCFLVGLGVIVGVGIRLRVQRPWMSLAVEFRPLTGSSVKVHLLVALLIAFPTAVLYLGIEPILQALGKNPTLTDRTLVWQLLVTLTENPWFGTGYESFWLGPRLDRIWAEYSWKPNQAHSGYVETYLSLGWIGVGFLFVILANGYQVAISALRRFPAIGGLMLAYFVIGIVFNCTEAAFFRMLTPVWFTMLLAMVNVPYSPTPDRRRSFGLAASKRLEAYEGAGGRSVAAHRNA